MRNGWMAVAVSDAVLLSALREMIAVERLEELSMKTVGVPSRSGCGAIAAAVEAEIRRDSGRETLCVCVRVCACVCVCVETGGRGRIAR